MQVRKQVRTGHGTTDWFQIGKGEHQGCILSPCLFNFCAEYIMRNSGLEEAQIGIKIARRNINNLRYADDTTLLAECEEELKSLLMKVKKENEKIGLKPNIQKAKIRASGPTISWQQSQFSVILEPNKIKSVIVSVISPSISHEVMGPDAMILIFQMLSFDYSCLECCT